MTTIRFARLVRVASAALFASAWLAAPAALGQQCANFGDVADDGPNGFCPSVEWVKNRGVTLGCGDGTNYCPQNAVSRLAMAAFMKRLGDALTPIELGNDLQWGVVDLDANTVLCPTPDLVVNGFPRTAYADASLSASATADVSFAADLVMSADGGTTWTTLNTTANRGSAPANEYGTLSDVGTAALSVGQTVRFGVRLSRGGIAGGTDLSFSRCQVRVLVYSRTGTSTPF